MRIAIGTCRTLPEPDPDQDILLDALRAAGADPVLLAWDDDAPIPTDLQLCVLRSTWDYYRDPDRFLRWIDNVARATTLCNPPDVVRWNIHKRYLAELESRGVPIVPTEFINRGAYALLAEIMNRRGWNDVVVKPAISAASYRTKRFNNETIDEGQAFLTELLTDGDTLIQRYMPEVDRSGERSLIWIDGELTHCIRKEPRFHGADESVSDALTPTAAECDFASRAMRGFEDRCLYARVDIMQSDDGDWLLSELELIEPSLFLVQHPPALRRLTNALVQLANAATR